MNQHRLHVANQQPERATRDYVLYWMTAARRLHDNAGFDHARALALRLSKPLLVFEALRCDWPWATVRTHRFVAEGMAANAHEAEQRGVGYFPYLEPSPGAAQGLLAALSARACVVVADAFPCTFVPRMLAAAARRLDVALHVVDSNGVLPLACGRAFARAVDLRRFLQKNLGPHLLTYPDPDPAPLPGPRAEVPTEVLRRWPASELHALLHRHGFAAFALHSGGGAGWARGGAPAAQQQLQHFLDHGLPRYDQRSHPDANASSELSAWLHWGHLSVHRVLRALCARSDWTPERFGHVTNGSKAGWWGLDANSEAFLDELITWRELGYQFCQHQGDDYDRFATLPAWALSTLREHECDVRPIAYDRATLESAATHDALWNAAQTQLVREGRMHNYLRMLWGKKILEWSRTPQDALASMIELNNRYALDGTNPNSYTGIMWVLGRFDRPWFPQRSIFGSVRYMSSDNTRRKLDLKQYLARYAPALPASAVSPQQQSFLT